MNKLFMSLFLAFSSLSFIESGDYPNKSYLVIHYDTGVEDKILIDNREISCHTCIWNAVQHVLDKRGL